MRIFVSVGTDHHPFDRLVKWALDWKSAHPDDGLFMQYGSSPAPRGLDGASILGRAEMVSELHKSDVVVVSCGPGAVMDARMAGRTPVVVPRSHSLGEHVDDHQLAFAELLVEQGLAIAARDVADIDDVVEAARRNPSMLRCDPPSTDPAGLAAIPALVDGLMAKRTEQRGCA